MLILEDAVRGEQLIKCSRNHSLKQLTFLLIQKAILRVRRVGIDRRSPEFSQLIGRIGKCSSVGNDVVNHEDHLVIKRLVPKFCEWCPSVGID